jgi:protein O-mannosyl-transferase
MSRSPEKGRLPDDRNRRRRRNKASKTPGSAHATQNSGGPSVLWTAMRSARSRNWLLAAALVAAVFFAYQPAWHGGFVWDDDTHLLKNPVLQPGGLVQTWIRGDYLNYWPLTFTVYRLEYELWGLDTLGFHLVNIALHAVSALLLWRILECLRMPGALLAAAIFALHPVNVESVAWITQLKNVLSLALVLLSMLFYLLHDRDGGRWRFAASVGLFLLSALAKGMALTLPVVLLACAWWQRGRIGRRDLLRVLPFLLIAALMVCIEVSKQHTGQGNTVVRSDGFLSRAAVAGCAVWFYFWKFLWPTNLIFVYPRWNISERDFLSYLPGVSLVAILALAWWRRRSWGRPVVMLLVCYVALLLPVLGFVNIYFMDYSLVADHWQYAAMIVPCAALAGMVATLGRRFLAPLSRLGAGAGGEGGAGRSFNAVLEPPVRYAFCLGLLAILAVLTFRQSGMYADVETLYRTTIERNPNCWLAQNNLGVELERQGRILMSRGRIDKATAHYREAVTHYQDALRAKADYAGAHVNLGVALARLGRTDEAIPRFQAALRIDPDCVEAQSNLGRALLNQGRFEEAITHFNNALANNRNNPIALNGLAWLRATCPESAFRDGAEAVDLARRAFRSSKTPEPTILDTLAAAYAEAGRFREAVQTAQMAFSLARQQNNVTLAESVKARLRLYEAGTPYRQSLAAPPPER